MCLKLLSGWLSKACMLRDEGISQAGEFSYLVKTQDSRVQILRIAVVNITFQSSALAA